MQRIIRNFLSNAVRYTDKGGLLLGARSRGGKVMIEVFDTGPGIPQDKHALVFEEFRRLRNSSSMDTKAVGLGLAIVTRIASLLGHQVGLRSREGRGSCFSLSLDQAYAPGHAEPRLPKAALARRRGPQRCAILIENEMQILAGMVELLETRNIKAIPSLSAIEALEALDTMEHLPDIIIADYHLDDGTGHEAIELLRKKCGKKIPSIIITANHTATLKSDLARQDVNLLWKPIKPQQLFETIDAILA